MEVKWITFFGCTPAPDDPRVSMSGWIIPSNPVRTEAIMHFYAINEISAKNKLKGVYHLPLVCDDVGNIEKEVIKKQIEDCVRKIGEACDYYEEHGKFTIDK